jgi:hypothetical protein
MKTVGRSYPHRLGFLFFLSFLVPFTLVLVALGDTRIVLIQSTTMKE